MSKVMPSKFWTEIFDNGEVLVEQDKDGNYRVSFFEDNHWKDEYVYVKFKNTAKYRDLETEDSQKTNTTDEDTISLLNKYLKDYKPYKVPDVYFDDVTDTQYIPKCCKNCSNHPSNGGTGVCHCTLPYYDNGNPNVPYWKYDVTC